MDGPAQFASAEGSFISGGVHVFSNNGFIAAMRDGKQLWSTAGKLTDAARVPGGVLVVAGPTLKSSIYFVPLR